jgi:lipopolysaccharide heptosyltransferase I
MTDRLQSLEKPDVLIVKMSSLGDLFHALPTLTCLRRGLDARIDWVVNTEYADLVRCFEDVAGVLPFPRREGLAARRAFSRELRGRTYDLVVDLQGLLKSAWVARMPHAARRIGPSFCREGAQYLYREIAGRKNKNRHAVEECLDVVRYLGLPLADTTPRISFPPFERDAGQPAVALVPRSRWETKNWTEDGFAAVGRALVSQRGAAVYLLGGDADRAAAERIAEQSGVSVENLTGRTTLPELGGVLAAMDLVVAVDSGPVHIAAALGTPVLGLYGWTDPVRTGPHGQGHRVIRPEGQPPSHRAFRRVTEETRALMGRIPADRVIREAIEMLDARRASYQE